jgi:MYXO-CTERM domain-containing protein
VNKRCALGSRAAALGFLIAVSSAQGAIFDFSYSFPGQGLTPISVTANGVFTTSAFNGTSYTITGITGFRNGQAITGLLPPGTYPSGGFANDNLLSPSNPFLDVNGVSFKVAGAGDDGTGDVNVFFVGGTGYSENSDNVGIGTFTLTAVTSSVPEPGSMVLAAGGLLALAFLRRSWLSSRP